MSTEDHITLVAVPDSNTDAMVSFLGDLFEQMVGQLPFSFSHGDIMSAAMYLVVDAGLVNAPSPERLRQDVIDALDRIIAERATEKRAKH